MQSLAEQESVTAYSDGEEKVFIDTYTTHGSPITIDYSFPYAIDVDIITISVTSNGVVNLSDYVSSIKFDQVFELEFECSDYGTDEIIVTFSNLLRDKLLGGDAVGTMILLDMSSPFASIKAFATHTMPSTLKRILSDSLKLFINL
jgi:hypothetical protein